MKCGVQKADPILLSLLMLVNSVHFPFEITSSTTPAAFAAGVNETRDLPTIEVTLPTFPTTLLVFRAARPKVRINDPMKVYSDEVSNGLRLSRS